ncbi:(2Fe-2S) ferredoxin domain-containing protein [Prescottella equi]|uniref:(2Fe-2S) ferredoxin domain-containing protein n=1 Tax=Rhodococcus hoagii TaxID=43767 RepID=A0AAE3B971_RHOHA|nr:(2Fe-2S) ferredoxin domain-containing protein [Prescottella equi]AVP67222.1 ferredoxin [Prescottella equi]MBM4482732.1 (2Fe-2S) ferredoxin domain-containing protein [Prescottella equi]MBM4522207.1 (2Fe-2S) ferredoxin domain-containing protein [Prescottella equi]MBM4527996.1 (2Fe-2S) ferredoxin domain-containing protein [Prescottella equi]MBM4539208.1 (2Fe-2S) ferredoxin domain-containing protein [Prescottella equi]
MNDIRPRRWVVVTAPTDRGDDPRDQVRAALHALGERHPDTVFRTAVLGGSGTSVTGALDEAAASGAAEIVVVSAQTVLDRKIDAWFRRVVGHWLRERGAGAPDVRLAPPLSDTANYTDLLDAAISGATTPARTTTAPLTSPAWDEVPGFTRHVLVCRGPRCSARGGPETAEALDHALEARGLGDDDVLVTQTGCMFPCSQAPVVAVYPDDTWYCGLTADRIDRLVDEHLVAGRPVTEWHGARRRSAILEG